MAKDNDLKTPNVPPLRFPGFTDEWEQVCLGEITTNFNLRNREKIDYPMYSVTNNRGFVPQSEQFEDREMKGEDVKAYKIIHSNDFAYNPARINVGSIAKYNGKEPCMISSLYVCFKANDGIDEEWLMHLLRTPKVQYYYQLNGEGGVRIYLFYPNFARIRTSIPNKEEQRKIANLLNKIDERIATQNKIIEDLKKLKSAISALFFEGHYVSDNSIGWKTVTLGDITENFHHRNKNSDSYPMYSVTNTSGFSPQHEVFEGKEIKDEDISIYKIIHKGEFAYNPARINVGSIGRYDEETPCMISSLYVCFRPTAEVDSDWLLYYLQSAKKIYQYGIFGEGGVRIYLFYPNFSRIEALLPPLTVQKEIASILKSFNQKIKLEELLLSKYQEQKKFMLSNMFI